jgi:hypothetical protein
MKITTFEHALLKQMADIDDGGLGPQCWGAAVGEATEYLHSHGYIRRIIQGSSMEYELTDRGKAMALKPYSETKD